MWEELFEEAYRKFSDIDKNRKIPRYRFNSYELCHVVRDVQWRTAFAERMVGGELAESINELNAWVYHLNKLKTWHDLLVTYEDEDAGALRFHFVEPLVRYCMLQPSSTRDRLVRVATNGVHQINLAVDSDYEDVLDQDKLREGRFLGRKMAEAHLERLVKSWALGDSLMIALRRLDSGAHRRATLDYRNEASHFIAPRLEFGEVQLVTRRFLPDSEFEQLQQFMGDTFSIQYSRKLRVSYGFGGIRPLSLAEIIEINSQEYEFAVSALDAYSDLLREAFSQMTKIINES